MTHGHYACIECGHPSPELYKDFQGGIIKISHCERCSGIVDKYIEFDSVIVCLDAILHKPQTYRHLLFNSDTSSAWKLIMIFLLCDTYIKWSSTHTSSTGTTHTRENHLFYAAFESEIYSVFVIVFIEWVIFCAVVILLLNSLQFFLKCHLSSPIRLEPFSKVSFVFTHRVLVLSSFGKLLAIPAVIWGHTFGTVYLPLTKVLTITSNFTALKVVYEEMPVILLLVLFLGHITEHAAGEAMLEYLYV